MRHVERRQTLPYTAEQLFDLVNDVNSYPKFLPWCRAARAVPEGPNIVVATLEVGIGGVRTSFTTRNTLARPRSIRMDLRAGPFRRLRGEWRFEPRAGAYYSRERWQPAVGVGLNFGEFGVDTAFYWTAANIQRKRRGAFAVSLRIGSRGNRG